MSVFAPSLAPIRPSAPEEIPVLDLGDYLAGRAGAREWLGIALRQALEQVGFYFVVNHGVRPELVRGAFEAARQFHARPEEAKLALRMNPDNIGYMPFRASVTRHSQLNTNNKPNLVEAFFIKRDLPPDHPDRAARRAFRDQNKWPKGLAGFREAALAYCDAMERLGTALLPLYAIALGLPPDWFDAAFVELMYTLRLSHYPRQDVPADNEFGLAPHSDSSFMTLLAQAEIPGLSVCLPNGNWLEAPAIPGSFLVNGGDLLRRWTNERFLATLHRVINRSGRERYAIPFFMDCSYDWRMACLPTCQGPDDPPRYEPITYPDYMTWFRNPNYAAAVRDKDGVRLD